MVLKIAAEETATRSIMSSEAVVIREYDEKSDKAAAEELERRCEFGGAGGGPRGKPSLVTDMLGDPLSRIRHFKTRLMLVAEYGEEKEIVGIVRACVKNVTRGNSIYVKLGYILGLRVSPMHRRLSIGTELVKEVEKWCKEKGAEYSYMMTDCTNQASINLFTKKSNYSKFRTPTMLVQPVHAHKKPISSNVAIVKISNKAAELIYRKIFAKSEFFPKDIDAIFSSRLNLGTFVAVPKKSLMSAWDPQGSTPPRGSYAILSVWNTKEVYQLEVRGVSGLTYACCEGSRVLDSWMPWLRLPSFPDVFRKFGVLFLYGLHMEGKVGPKLMESLCSSAYNMARKEGGCGAVVAEVAQRDPVRAAIPHWRRLSFPEDLWCVKKLSGKSEPSDWVNSRPPPDSPVIFVDPRDF